MKAYKNYILVKRVEPDTTTKSGIIMVEDTTEQRGLRVEIVSGRYDGLDTGSVIYVDKIKVIRMEGQEEVYAVEPQHILAVE